MMRRFRPKADKVGVQWEKHFLEEFPLSNNKQHFRLPSFVETITNNAHAEEGKRQTKRQKVSS
jgi:hypothetical protein